jgi:hypothetical protein
MKRDTNTTTADQDRVTSRARTPDREPATARSEPVESLHAVAGNQAVKELYERGEVQPKLAVTDAADASEREAEKVADDLLRMEDAEADAADGPVIRRRPTGGASGTVDGETEAHIRSVTSGGRPLPTSVRSYFEPRLDRDFSDVRVHTGPDADAAARAIDAEAFTHGTDLVFSRGSYRPNTRSGRELLAHELTHVVQQTGERGVARQTIQRQESEQASQANEWLELSEGAKDAAKSAATDIAKKVASKSLGGYYTAGEIAAKLAGAAIEGIGKGIEKAQKRGVEKVKKAWSATDKLVDHGEDVTDRELLEQIKRNRSPTLNALAELNTVLTEMTVSVAKKTVDMVVGSAVDYIAGKLGDIVDTVFTDALHNWGVFGWDVEDFVKEATESQVKKMKSNMKSYVEGILRSALEAEGV